MTNEKTIETIETIEMIKSFEKYYQLGIDSYSTFASLVIDEISELYMAGYNIFEILPRNTIEETILRFGTDLILAELNDQIIQGLVSANPGGPKMINYSLKTPLYKQLFDDWQKKGWVIINQDIQNKKFDIRFNDDYFNNCSVG